VFSTSVQSHENGRMFARDSGSKTMGNDMVIHGMDPAQLASAWQACVRKAAQAREAVQDEIDKSVSAQVCGRVFRFFFWS
jgi:hypothetical protein